MDVALAWKACFAAWPEKLPRRGVLVTNYDEQINFANFWVGEGTLLVERQTPDTIGARNVILPYANIAAVKFTDVLKPKDLLPLGFQPHAKSKTPA